MKAENRNKEFNPKNSPVFWFCLLEQSRNNYDFAQAAEAKRQLERLGVIVEYCCAGGNCHAG